MKEARRNPVWTRDELILALDFYLRHRPTFPDQASVEIKELSDELNQLSRILGLAGGETFRNPNGAYMKLMNFRALDPQYRKSGGVGLQRGGKQDKAVWDEFADHLEELSSAAAAIRALLTGISEDEADSIADIGDDPEITEAVEGALLTRIHRVRERNRKIVDRKKQEVLSRSKRLSCEACGFDFRKTCGERGEGFIECHHTKPLSELKAGSTTRTADLVLVCANCHRMIHAKRPWLSIGELKATLRSAGQN